MKKYLFLFIIVSFLAGCGSGGGGSAPPGGDSGTNSGDNALPNGSDNTGTSSGTIGGSKVIPDCSRTGKIAKLKVSEDGIYRVTYSDLYGDCSGLSGVDPATINLSSQGEDDIAIDYIDSNGNNSFDAEDYIEFYGKALGRDDSRFRYTETNVYWLSVGEKAGKRIAYSASSPPAPPGQSSFVKVLHMEKDIWYEQKNYPAVTSPNEVREHWFWGEVFYPKDMVDPKDPSYPYPFKRDYDFSTLHIDRSKPVSMKIRLQSVSGSPYTKVFINGHAIADQVLNSQWPDDILVTSIDPSYFYPSLQNKLTIESVGGGLFYLDWFEVTFYHTYMVDDNFLEFTGTGQIELSNFFSPGEISVYEVSDPAGIRKINPTITTVAATGERKAKISGNPDNSERFLALTSSKKKTPSVEIYAPANLKSKPSGFIADYVIVTHEDFYDAITPLANYRANEGGGYSVLTVKTKDIYDEFGYGIGTPQAIRDFLSYAYNNWATKYVLLVGDATFDYKDISNYGATHGVKSYVPTYLYNYPVLGEVPSDNWFADVDDANGALPEMFIGRIPAKTVAEVDAVIAKIKRHESSITPSNKVLLIADHDPAYTEPIFENLSESLAEVIPDALFEEIRLYKRDNPDDLGEKIISEISSGQLLVNYTGHGSVGNWAKEGVFSSEDVSLLTNQDNYPFVVAMNCLNGYFVLADDYVEYPDPGDSSKTTKRYPSLSESLLLADNKGALAVWSASAIGYPSEHDPLAQALYNLIFNENVTVLGDAVTEAKERAYFNNNIPDDVVQTFIFFGDPATRLK